MSIDPLAAREFSIDVIRTLREAGYEAYWAGGCVRDQLLGKQPEDYDVATNAQPNEVRTVFGNRRSLPIGASFGVISVLGPKEAGAVEVATFRQDAPYSDGRRPDHVTFCNAEHDAQRRDFTINGIFFDPIHGKTIDYVGGLEDLDRRVIRAIGDPHARIREDKLRMLRAIRFTATLQFDLESSTYDAICTHADEIKVVSSERIVQELRRMFAHSERVRALTMLHESRLLDEILPEFSESLNQTQAPDARWSQIVAAVRGLRRPNLASVLALLFRHAVDTKAAEEIGRRLRISRDEWSGIAHFLANELAIRTAGDHDWPRVQRILVRPLADDLLDYCHAVADSEAASLEGVEYCRHKRDLPEAEWNPSPLIDGGDLKELNVPVGPRFKELLDAVRDEQLMGRIHTKQDAVAWLRQHCEW